MLGDTFGARGGDRATLVTGGSSRDVSCFADEVVIDFPSVHPAVDRVRRGFMADERPVDLAATLTLTADEARRGATVPLEVALPCTCIACGGRGESWAERCARCHGDGSEVVRHGLQVRVPAGVTDGDCFHFTLSPRQQVPTRIELRVLVG